MEIYIETFLIQNILINFCLIKLVYITTKSKSSFFKILLSSTIGSISSVISVIFLDNNIFLNITKFITAISMIAVAFKQNKKQFITNIILLFIYTYAFGGLITSLSSQTYYTSFGAIMTSKFSIELICVLVIVATYIFELVLRNLKLKIKTNNLLYNLTLTQGKNSIKVNAYLDTGNFLNHNGQPVLILDLDAYLKLTKINIISFYTTKTEEIKTGTVNGHNNLKIFRIDKMEIKNGKSKTELKNQIIAINTTNCFKNTNYQALLSPLFLWENKLIAFVFVKNKIITIIL